MKRSDFIKIVKIVSIWRVDKRRGNYKLPSGNKLSDYLYRITDNLLKNNKWAIAENGNIYDIVGDQIFIPFGENEPFVDRLQWDRVDNLINEMLF